MKEKMKFKNVLTVTGVGTLVAGVIGVFIFSPVIVFGCAYLGGMILQWIVGDAVAGGLNLVFDTTRFTPQIIPLTCATFATIGKYFKSSHTTTTEKKED